jgi:thioesterase domain-containing protein
MLSDTQRALLAARLRRGRDPVEPGGADRAAVELSTGEAPLFALHAVSGSVHEYMTLAAGISGAFGAWGITAAGLRPGTEPVTSLAEMAHCYAAVVASTRPAGPVWLMGWSMGGVLAFETALELESSGRELAGLVLIDAPYLTPPRYADSEEGLVELFAADAERALGQAPGHLGAEVGRAHGHSGTEGGLGAAARLDRLAWRMAGDDGDLAAIQADVRRRYNVFAAHTTALAGYQPRRQVKADVLLVQADGSKDSATPWSRMFTGAVTTMTVASDHYGCLRPPAVTVIADAIRRLPQVAQEGGCDLGPMPRAAAIR